jgi:hypothetical protein
MGQMNPVTTYLLVTERTKEKKLISGLTPGSERMEHCRPKYLVAGCTHYSDGGGTEASQPHTQLEMDPPTYQSNGDLCMHTLLKMTETDRNMQQKTRITYYIGGHLDSFHSI